MNTTPTTNFSCKMFGESYQFRCVVNYSNAIPAANSFREENEQEKKWVVGRVHAAHFHPIT